MVSFLNSNNTKFIKNDSKGVFDCIPTQPSTTFLEILDGLHCRITQRTEREVISYVHRVIWLASDKQLGKMDPSPTKASETGTMMPKRVVVKAYYGDGEQGLEYFQPTCSYT